MQCFWAPLRALYGIKTDSILGCTPALHHGQIFKTNFVLKLSEQNSLFTARYPRAKQADSKTNSARDSNSKEKEHFRQANRQLQTENNNCQHPSQYETHTETFLEDAFADLLLSRDPKSLTKPQLAILEQVHARRQAEQDAKEKLLQFQLEVTQHLSPKKEAKSQRIHPSSLEINTKPESFLEQPAKRRLSGSPSRYEIDRRGSTDARTLRSPSAQYFEEVERDVQSWLDGERCSNDALGPTPAEQKQSDFLVDEPRIDGSNGSKSRSSSIFVPKAPSNEERPPSTTQGKISPRKSVFKPSQKDLTRATSSRISDGIPSAASEKSSRHILQGQIQAEAQLLESKVELLKTAVPNKRVFFEIMQCQHLEFLSDQTNAHVASQIAMIKNAEQAGFYPEPLAVLKDEKQRDRETILDLSYRGLGDDKLIAVTSLALGDLQLESLDLSSNRLSDKGGAAIFQDLASEQIILTKNIRLILARNSLALSSCEVLSKAIKVQNTGFICELDLSRNRLDSTCARVLAESLRCETALKMLNISYNPIGVAGALHIADGLRDNSSLQILSLAWTQITGKGALAIIRAIIRTECLELKSLDLSRNAIGRAIVGDQSSLPPAVNGSILGTLMKLLENNSSVHLYAKGQHTTSGSGGIEHSASSSRLPKKKKYEPYLGRSTSRQELRKSSLIHINLSYNLFSEGVCHRFADALQNDRTTVGVHLDGNAAFLDPLGNVIVRPPSTEMQDGQTTTDLDASETLQEFIRQTEILPFDVRFDMIASAFHPRATCWLCAGFLPKRFNICAAKQNVVCLHTSFDVPPWSGCPMVECKFAEARSIDTIEPSSTKLSSKIERIATTAMRLGEELFDMAEYAVNRICPPGEVAFFFTVNGIPVISDLEQQVQWKSTHAHDRVLPPPAQDPDNFYVNIVSIEPRQSLSRKALGHDTKLGYSDASFRLAHSPSTWALRQETDGMLSGSDLSAKVSESIAQSRKKQYDPMCLYIPGALKEFWYRCPPRSLELKPGPNIIEQNVDTIKSTSWVNHRLKAHFRAQFGRDARVQLFEADWVASEISSVISSRVEQERTRSLLDERYDILSDTFLYYTSSDLANDEPRSGMLISQEGFIQFFEHISEESSSVLSLCKEEQALELFNLAVSEQQDRYIKEFRARKLTMTRQATGDLVSSGAMEGSHLAWGITRPRFMNLLLKIALASFEKEEPRESAALSKLMTSFVLVRAQRFDRRGYIQTRLHDTSVHEILRRNIPTMLRLYANNTGRYQGGFEAAWMSVGEWIRGLKQAGFLATSNNPALGFNIRGSQSGTSSSIPIQRRSSASNPASDFSSYGDLHQRAATLVFAACIPQTPHDEPTHDRYFKMDFISYLLAMSCVVAYSVSQDSVQDFVVTGVPVDYEEFVRRSTIRHTAPSQEYDRSKRNSTKEMLRRMSKVL